MTMSKPTLHITGAEVYVDGAIQAKDIAIVEGRIAEIAEPGKLSGTCEHTLDMTGRHLFPGFADVHVHLREPGQSRKETIATGTAAAARGGYTCVCSMPNLNPVPDTLEHLEAQRAIIRETALVHVLPYGAITMNEKGKELADMEAMAPYVCGFSDDGVGVQSDAQMEEAMLEAKRLGKCIVAHAEDESLVQGGVIHDGEYARAHGHKGNPSASEWKQVERDCELVRKTGASYHVCHVSTKETIALVRKARAEGYDVTCETGPHYLTMDDSMLQEEGRFRMNPPIRGAEDRKALVEALLDGTVLCIATDHAPHTEEEKSRGLDHSLNGIVGLETAFPVLYTDLVKPGIVPLERVIEALTTAPVERFRLYEVEEALESLGVSRGIKVGEPADLTIFDLNAKYAIDPSEFLSKGKACPFWGKEVYGRCEMTLVGGTIVYADERLR